MVGNWSPIRAYEDGGYVHAVFEHEGKIICFRYEPQHVEDMQFFMGIYDSREEYVNFNMSKEDDGYEEFLKNK